MYYVIQVGAGRENKAEQMIRRYADEALYSACFHPVRHEKKKIKGQWTHLYETLIPGYVFVEMERDAVPAFYKAIRRIQSFMKLLGSLDENGERIFQPLPERDEQWLRRVADLDTGSRNDADPVVELSQIGFDENDRVLILSGPLKGFEGQIRKINLHQRWAEVEAEFMNRKTTMRMGIEIIAKQGEEQDGQVR